MKNSERAKRIQPSASVAASELVARLRAEGSDIIGLTVGEPDCDSPAHVVKAAAEAAASGKTHYTPVSGLPELKQAIVDKFGRENNLQTSIDQIVVATGAKQIIFTALAATLDVGDEVVIPAPYWVSYPDMVEYHGAKPVVVDCLAEKGFKLTAEQLEQAISPQTKWVVLNSPNNPTGAVYNEKEQRALIAVLKRHPHVWLLTDEIYEHFVYDGAGAVSPAALDPDIADRCLTVNGVSKAYAMTGWRIGYATGPKALVKEITKIISQVTTCPSSVSQMATVAALSGDQSFVKNLADDYKTRRDAIVSGLDAAEGIKCTTPEGAFYVYADVSGLIGKTTVDGDTLVSDLDVAKFFINQAGVSTIAGTAYGLSPYVRCSFATAIEEIEKACTQITAACKSLT